MSDVTTTRTLNVNYSSDAGNKVTHSMNVREDVTAEEVSTVADTIIGKNVFEDSSGNPIAVAESAYTRTITQKRLF